MLRIVSFVLALSMVTAPALAGTITMKCQYNQFFRYIDPWIGASKIEERKDGQWIEWCNPNVRTETRYDNRQTIGDKSGRCDFWVNVLYKYPTEYTSTIDFVTLRYDTGLATKSCEIVNPR